MGLLNRIQGKVAINAADIKNLIINGTPISATPDQINALGSRILVANKTGAPLTAGALVYINGYDTTLAAPTVAKADASNVDTLAQYVLPEAIANNTSGYAEIEYTTTALDTSLAAAVGSAVYLSVSAPGSWQLTVPTGADQSSQIVGVVKVKSATVGEIRFFPGKTHLLRIGTSDLQDEVITDAKMADDVKVGSLALLTTDVATSLQAAINEVDSHADTAQGAADAKYTKPVGGIPSSDMDATVQASLGKADAAIASSTGFTILRAKKALQMNGHGTTPVNFQTADAASISGGAGPYDFSGVGDGATILITPDDEAEDTATFNCAAGRHESGLNPSVDISGGSDNKFKIQVDDDVGGAQTVTLTLAGLSSGAAIATEMQTKIRALGDVYAAVTVTYDHAPAVDHYTITSTRQGTGSKVRITPADDHNVTEELKLGTADGGTNIDGTGDASDWAAVTKEEVAILINGDIAAVTASGAGSVLTITSNTTGKDSRVLAGAGTLNTLIGCPNGEVDYGAQGMGYGSNMTDGNYIVMLTLNDTADPTTKCVSANSRTTSGFNIISDGAADADYVDILVVGT